MNVHASHFAPALNWEDASRSVNAWRGVFLQCFGSVESAITETLACLATSGERGTRVRLRHLVGQRFQDLQDALDPGGPFEFEGASAATALRALRQHEQVRTVLAHGCARIALDRRGRWIVEFRYASFRGRDLERHAHLFEQDAADTLLKEVRRLGNRVLSKLETLRHAVAEHALPSEGQSSDALFE